MEYNATKVKCKCGQTETATLYQYDYGQTLFFEGFDLPEVFEVHFSKSKSGEAVTVLGSDNAVLIPDDLLQSAGKIHAWVYLHATENDGETEYHVTIPVTARAKPTHEEPTPVQQSEIEQLIAVLENDQGRAESAAERAETAATSASQSAQSATQSARSASASEENARQYAQSAQQSATASANSASSAATSESNAAQSAEDAEHYADMAEQIAGTAGFMFMEIDANGHLVYTRTDQVDADFHVEHSNGHLILEAV